MTVLSGRIYHQPAMARKPRKPAPDEAQGPLTEDLLGSEFPNVFSYEEVLGKPFAEALREHTGEQAALATESMPSGHGDV